MPSAVAYRSPRKMLKDLRKRGFRVSLWQLSYFTPTNRLFRELVDEGLVVTDRKGGLPTEDAILDFSNPKAVAWYQKHLAKLLRMGVSAIKVDFGEAAPLHGRYASGLTGYHEHNLYPLRYNRAAAEISARVTKEHIIWARSAWAGSQRYPLHWGGDAEITDSAMAATLRGGLSLGLCGFSFWSHDIGGFVRKTPRDLYRRWTPFGMLTSHSRCHGAGEKEPWTYDKKFMDEFRLSVEMKYRLMPYVVAQAADSAAKGHPMLRTLFFEYPEDPASWLVEDQYLFGRDLLVAPLMEDGDSRDVYLPPGAWVDYQTGAHLKGGRWVRLKAGAVPCVVLARGGAAIPHLEMAQSTAFMDWSRITVKTYGSGPHEGLLCRPGERKARPFAVRSGRMEGAAARGRTRFTVSSR